MTFPLEEPTDAVGRLPNRSKGSRQISTEEDNAQRKKALVDALAACMAVQRTYGKQAGDLLAISRIFRSVLADFSAEQITEALKSWLLKNRDFPTPHDIYSLLREDKPKNRDVYMRIVTSMRQNAATLRQWEWDYMREFERENA